LKRLVIATTNPGKVIEIQSALGELPGWKLEPIPPDTPSIEETGKTFMENAILKAEHYSKYVNDLTLADDSGLCVDAIGGRPGVHSARYAPDPPSRIKRILQEMQSVPDDQRHAVFYCALAVARAGNTIWTFEGEVAGVISRTPAGTGGFGYDPVFLLPALNRTMGELGTEDKTRLSARGKAVAELRKFLRQ
jgi:non-canonical purine NTP pyrophosphatase (RdgB/HAM1 family)